MLRGLAFLGDAMSHGMLPGVALASLLGGSLVLGALVAAVAMAAGVTALGRSPRLSQDTGIGLLFAGMLSLGVIIVSHSRSFAVDLTGFLFGDVLAVGGRELGYLVAALLVAGLVSVVGHRMFVALAFDPRKARTLGLRPRLAQALMLGLVTLAIVASFHVVGTLLVFRAARRAARRHGAVGHPDSGDHAGGGVARHRRGGDRAARLVASRYGRPGRPSRRWPCRCSSCRRWRPS